MQDFAPVVVHHVPPDVKEAQAVLRRREAEQARQERIFDVKQRTIGLDTGALQAQIATPEDGRFSSSSDNDEDSWSMRNCEGDGAHH